MRNNNVNNTAPSSENLAPLNAQSVPHSGFDLTRQKDTTATIGTVVPIDIIDTDIDSTYHCHYSILSILRNPLVARMMSGCRVFMHATYSRKSDLWKGYPVMATGGVRGDVEKEIPRILLRDNVHTAPIDSSSPQCDYSTPMSLADYLGIPITSVDTSVIDRHKWHTRVSIKDNSSAQYKSYMNNVNYLDSSTAPNLPSGGFCANALPFVKYQKDWRQFFAPRELMLDNKKWFPDDDDDFILPFDIPTYEWDEVSKTWSDGSRSSSDVPAYANNYVNVLDKNHPTWSKRSLNDIDWSEDGPVYVPSGDMDTKAKTGGTLKCGEVPPILTALHYRQFRGDYFNTALPYPDLIKGSIPTIQNNSIVDWSDVMADVGNTYTSGYGITGEKVSGQNYYATKALLGFIDQRDTRYSDPREVLAILSGNSSGAAENNTGFRSEVINNDFVSPIDKARTKKLGEALNRIKIDSQITRSALNEMLVATAIKERMARTDGSYNQYVQSFFNYDPNMYDRKSQYLGGSFSDIEWSDVIQTSESSTTSQLGDVISRGFSFGDLQFDFHSPDNGYIIVYAEIVPDVWYCSQGIDRMWTNTLRDDFYLPIQNNLGPEPILNKELMMSSTPADNNNIFAWTERGRYAKDRRNQLGGMFALPSTISNADAQCHMKRRFSNVPKLNPEFVTMSPKNIDRSPFANANDVEFNLSVVANVQAVLPRPYTTTPNMGSINF